MISRIQVKTDLNALQDILNWFEQFNALPVTDELWWQCETTLAEGFTNAVRYAHRDLPESTPIEIEVTVLRQWFEIRIWDYGQPFDLQSKLKAMYKQQGDPLQKFDGRGLIFMDRLSDEVSYTRTADSRNCLLLRKKVPD